MKLHIKLIKERKPIDIKEIEEDYKINLDDIFDDSTTFYRRIQYIIFNKLTTQEKNIRLYYAEVGKQELVAKKLGVSTATMNKTVQLIRQKIINYLYGNNTESNTDNNNNSNPN